MTLLDAPKFDAVRDRRQREVLWICVGTLVVLFVASWFIAGRPVDWPWNWYTHFRGQTAINSFLKDVERDDLNAAYGVWNHDPDWQKHPERLGSYDFNRFEQDWSPNSSQNEYGAVKSHKIVAHGRQRVAGGNSHQRSQEQGSLPQLRSRDQKARILAGRALPGAIGAPGPISLLRPVPPVSSPGSPGPRRSSPFVPNRSAS
jgi:hypothetical protein